MAPLLFPVAAQVSLTFALILSVAMARRRALLSGEVKMRDIALGQQDPWPERSKVLARSMQNQFETPILFYAVVAIAIASHHVTLPLVVLAWAWVATRFGHALVHTGSNQVARRFAWFLGGVVTLMAQWCVLAFDTAMRP